MLKTFSIIGYSIEDEVLCPSCLPAVMPVTREVLTHTCSQRMGPELEHDPATGRPVLKLTRKPSDRLMAVLRRLGWTARSRSADLVWTHTNPSAVLPDVVHPVDTSVCPACRAHSAAQADGPLHPLFFGDPAVREEVCTYCQGKLLDLALARQLPAPAPLPASRGTFGPQRRPALRFERRPAPEVLADVYKAGWRWEPKARVWVWLREGAPVYPPSLNLPPPPAPKPTVVARPPIIRRKSAPATA